MGWALVVTTICIGMCILIGNDSKVRQFYKRAYHRIVISVLVVFGSYFCYQLVYQERVAIKGFFDAYINVFTGIGYLAVAIGLIFTAYQIMDSKKKTRARFSYDIRKDGMELDRLIDKNVRKAIESEVIPDNLKEETEANIKVLLQRFAIMHRQKLFGNIEDDEWDALLNWFECFLGKNPVKNYWNSKVNEKNGWTDKFVKLGEQFVNSERRKQ